MTSRRTWLAAPLLPWIRLKAAGRIEAFGMTWSVPLEADWKVSSSEGEEALHLLVPRPGQEKPRRPFQYALADAAPFRKVTLECEVRRIASKQTGALILVYAWRGPEHFNYVHLCGESATSQPVHNGVFHVYGGDRVRISSDRGPSALPTPDWMPVKLEYDSETGRMETLVNGKANPSLRAVDLSLGAGRIGLGSFFDVADFRRVKITSLA